MSGCVDDFSSLSPKRGIITIAGGLKLPIEGVGLVWLRCRILDDSTTLVELMNTLYSSELYDTRLFSWPHIRNRGSELVWQVR
jgi:hypothetical protein